MKNSTKKEQQNLKTIDEILIGRDLRTAKTVRTTFKLTDASVEAIEYLKQNILMSKKGLFSLIADSLTRESKHNDKILKAAKSSDSNQNKENLRKTFAVEKRAVSIFNKTAKQFNISRDSIINSALITLHVTLENSKKQEKENAKHAREALEKVDNAINECNSKLRDLFRDDHCIVEGFDYASMYMGTFITAVDGYSETGESFDPYSP